MKAAEASASVVNNGRRGHVALGADEQAPKTGDVTSSVRTTCLAYLAPAPAAAAGGPPWPFHLDRSWLLTRLRVSGRVMVAAGRVLVTVTIVGFAVAALGLLLGVSWWAPVAVAAAAVSLVQLTVWFHWWLPVGVVIDVALITALVWGPLSEWGGLGR